MGAFQILILRRTAQEAWSVFRSVPPFTDFRDASYGACYYKCSILHCLQGLEFAVNHGWFNLQTFDVQEYDMCSMIENGDYNWILPGKLLAFSTPTSTSRDFQGWKTFTPEDYIPIFRRLCIDTIVRLNNETYDAERFKQNGLNHFDLYFVDGSVPTDQIIQRFLSIVEQTTGAVAVHCKAGLGRTGTLIGCYIMKHFKMPAPAFIGWARLCRPGSVLGPQQQFLCDMEKKCFTWGSQQSSDSTYLGSMSPDDRFKAVHGDHGQAGRLVEAKLANQSPQSSPFVDRTLVNRITDSPNGRNRNASQGENIINSARRPDITPPPAYRQRENIFSSRAMPLPANKVSYASPRRY